MLWVWRQMSFIVKFCVKNKQTLTNKYFIARVDFGIMFLKNVVLHEIYSKKSVTEYFWHVSVPHCFGYWHNYIFVHVQGQSNEVQRRAKSIRSLIFYYIFHVKPHFLKTLFQSRLLFDFDDFTEINKDTDYQRFNSLTSNIT
jgi:hypothetical protein